eukprot:CAMPEP_0175515560 /NCGR_PEP_ID=MMETSP0096-20121207/13997_1 /TAXON_ID=311494 /ORGANISM="Alexandrium monilatum, Strain CCMP3105" /LENGTH=35 /DNA_ID= /DNA_START= /DNA_END= /DNA_ORIENTATION=
MLGGLAWKVTGDGARGAGTTGLPPWGWVTPLRTLL